MAIPWIFAAARVHCEYRKGEASPVASRVAAGAAVAVQAAAQEAKAALALAEPVLPLVPDCPYN